MEQSALFRFLNREKEAATECIARIRLKNPRISHAKLLKNNEEKAIYHMYIKETEAQ